MPVPNSVPRFVGGGVVGRVAISTANANRDGTGTVGTVLTAGAQGTLIELIRVIALGTTTAGMIRLFIHDGSAFWFYAEIPVTAVTPSATVVAFAAEYQPTTPLVLPSGYSLRAATEKAESFHVTAVGGEF